ncbi:MAG TPA: Hpt domain-containing protein [Phycisphaerae bacterium]|nr:Hpt domain-containing protein [Phycisphaerae bacterium]
MADQEREPTSKDADPLFSTLLAECPELWDVVEEFVHSLPDRVMTMQDALRDGSLDQLKMLAHQLKGAGASYGYQAISARAGEIEQAAHNGSIDDLAAKIAEVTALVARIQEGLEKGQ